MKNLSFFLYAIIAFLTISCNEKDSSQTTNGTALFNVHLTDAPGNYEEVLIDIQDVKINPAGVEDEEAWISLENINPGVYNLLDFTNGMDTLLASQELPSGTISQMRLVLGSNNQVKVDGEYYELKTPSAQQSGLKLNIQAELTEGIIYNIWVDFDAGRSIVAKGNGTYSLKPVIRTYTEATSGAIKGVIDPAESRPYFIAISSENDSIGTYADTLTGIFQIKGLEAGNYKLEVFPIENFQSLLIENIPVVNGVVHNLDTLAILKSTIE